MATGPSSGTVGRLRVVRDALQPAGMDEARRDDRHRDRAQRRRLGAVARCDGTPLSPEPKRAVRRRDRRPRLHPRHAPRLRRRPHLGDRQHHPEADGGGQAPAQRRLLLLARPLDDRVRAGGAAELRDPRPRRPGEERLLGPAQRRRASSGRRCPVSSSTSSRRSTSSSSSRSSGSSASFARARTTTRSSSEQLNKRGLMNRFFGRLARRIDAPWKMYPVGVLFGLGFDTATEVALLVLVRHRGGERTALLRDLVAPDPVRRGHVPVRHHGRLLHELRLRLGVLASDPEGVLQHHDHGALGRRRVPHRDDRAARPVLDRVQPATAAFWSVHGRLQHQHGPGS